MKKICIIIHLYYVDLWDEISNYLKNVNYDCDIHVSLTKDNIEQNKEFRNKVKDIDNIYIYELENKGLDIGPFLYVFNKIVKQGLIYDLMLKLHTKKGIHEKRNPLVGIRWRNQLMHPILKDKDTVNKIVNIFKKDKDTGIIGSKSWLVDRKHPGFIYNHQYIKEYIKIFNIKTNLNNIKFIGGTMFWCRFDVYSEFFMKHNVMKIYKDLETGAFTDSYQPRRTHALERILSLIMMDDDKKIIGI
jgi:lipopolysaccharide biosynthesis protein